MTSPFLHINKGKPLQANGPPKWNVLVYLRKKNFKKTIFEIQALLMIFVILKVIKSRKQIIVSWILPKITFSAQDSELH